MTHWIKLYTEILNDPKVGRLSDRLYRRFIDALLMAGTEERDGYLPAIEDAAYMAHTTEDEISASWYALEQVGLLAETTEGWLVVNFAKRQAKPDTGNAARVRRYRQRRTDMGMATTPGYNSAYIIARDGNKCVYCGSEENLCVDHVLPIIQGGDDETNNLVAACKLCNSGKAGRTPEEAGYTIKNKTAAARYKKYVTQRVTVTRNVRTDTESDTEQNRINIKREGGDKFQAVKQLVEQHTGMPAMPGDVPALQELADMDDLQESDVVAAVAFFKTNGNVARGAAHLLKSIKYQRAMRIQERANAPPKPARNGNNGKSAVELERERLRQEAERGNANTNT